MGCILQAIAAYRKISTKKNYLVLSIYNFRAGKFVCLKFCNYKCDQVLYPDDDDCFFRIHIQTKNEQH